MAPAAPASPPAPSPLEPAAPPASDPPVLLTEPPVPEPPVPEPPVPEPPVPVLLEPDEPPVPPLEVVGPAPFVPPSSSEEQARASPEPTASVAVNARNLSREICMSRPHAPGSHQWVGKVLRRLSRLPSKSAKLG